MEKTEIKVSCNDQALKITYAPIVASGGFNEVRVVFSFCEKWSGFVKTAVFYRDEEPTYYAILDENDTCVVPWEVCYEEGRFFFGVFGEKDNIRRTASVIRYKVKKGAVTAEMMPSDPSPDVYNQIIAMLTEIKTENDAFVAETERVLNNSIKHNIASIEKTGTNGLTDIYTITYLDGSTQTFTVTNGEKGDVGVFDADGEKTNINMDGYKVTGLGTPTADGDAVNLGYANKNFRPSTWSPTPDEIGAASMDYAKTFSRKNLLDNWYFGNPVNQRGQTVYDGSGYCIDRWKNGAVSVIEGEGLKATYADSIIVQSLEAELKAAIDGKECTVSVLCDGVMNTNTFTYTATPSAATLVMYGENVNVTILTGGSIHIAFRTVNSVIQAVKLELGSTQTLAHQENGVWVLNEIPNYAEELARCKRYLQVYRPQTLSGQTVHSPIGIGVAYSENRLEIDIPLSVPLRNGVLPSVLYSGDICAWDGQTERTATDFWVIGVSDADLRVGCSTSGATARGIYTLAVLKSNMDGYFMINAEL